MSCLSTHRGSIGADAPLRAGQQSRKFDIDIACAPFLTDEQQKEAGGRREIDVFLLSYLGSKRSLFSCGDLTYVCDAQTSRSPATAVR